MSIYQTVQDFINIGIKNGAIDSLDEIYTRNQLLHFIGLHDWEEVDNCSSEVDSLALMDKLLEEAQTNNIFTPDEREFYESALMNVITPLPSKVNHTFWKKYEKGPEVATDYFYGLSKQINQVKTRDTARNIAFIHPTQYGDLQITINLSKPEKDPKIIAATKKLTESDYPTCQLCVENEGFYGIGNKAARSNHRIVRVNLNGKKWGFQYSPYAYFNEHSILLNEQHTPMVINRQAFDNLLEFLDLFPQYTVGSNADLPIVGGSILTHDHYQAGKNGFPMAKAVIKEEVYLSRFPEIKVGIVKWPLSVLRMSGKDKMILLNAADEVLRKWKSYSDESLNIIATTSSEVQHHTITPIARMSNGCYELDLVLRDNNVSEEFPDGIFHPHPELHHIKKENIGLIEVMGLAVLPARLKGELAEIEKYLLGQENQLNEIHKAWADDLKARENFTQENVHEKVQQAVGDVFERVLQDAGVFKDNEAGLAGFRKFIDFFNAQ
ncbi:UDP-glucose--hexose-1-phosphate uridylyltransferase [Lactococcus kimchii]|uniref:UDP-glucose--hexose-1-phosphate uridylyltransferase n=1 Tax=Lactococcus sp. S-13 TaxID=2507158 RepID=UPI001022E141|nr:UDP-glucose--hexose-1-phosphate uridylyltransferase [Lactococcus sp. S-13]RZI49141.1 UDP-glucose--hexose-1-phosphate uridylyltransferase [Lactococcus sp. S-13]